MEYVGKLGNLISSVHNFYNEINPATLSGAIDIIVVEQEDGDLACSPFHVRFGKLSVLMPQEKRVQIRVNDELVPYVMKVGEAGEAFFVFETDHEVPEEFQTSPIMEALPEKNEEDPPYLDIGESKNQNKVVEQKTADSFEDDEKEGHKSQASLPAELQSPKMIIEEQMDKVVTKLDPFHKTNESSTPNVLGDSTDPLLKEDDISNIVMNDDVPKNDIYPLEDGSTLLERVIPEAITTTTIAKERFIVRPASGDIYSTWLDVTHTANHNRVENEKIKNDLNTINDSVDESGHGRGDESIVLDISGYKTGNVDEAWDEMDHSDHLETTTDPLVETISISHSNNDRARLHKPNEHTASSIIKIMAENVFNKANNHANRNMNEANADAADKEVKIYGGSAEKEIEEDATEKGDGAENEVREDGAENEVREDGAENEVREDGAENEAREDATEKGDGADKEMKTDAADKEVKTDAELDVIDQDESKTPEQENKPDVPLEENVKKPEKEVKEETSDQPTEHQVTEDEHNAEKDSNAQTETPGDKKSEDSTDVPTSEDKSDDTTKTSEPEGDKSSELTDEKTEVEEPPKPAPPASKPRRSLWGWGARRQETVESIEVDKKVEKTEEKEEKAEEKGEQKDQSEEKPNAKDEPVNNVKEEEEADDNVELVPGHTYRIEMSLCGLAAFGKDEEENANVFKEHQVTYDAFTHNPNILNDRRLVFRYEDRYYSAGKTGPLFTSLLLFKRPVEESTSPDSEDEDPTKVSDRRETYQFGKGWRQWLSRSSVAAPTTTENNETAEVKDDEKPQETTTFTTTMTTTSVGWTADHTHPDGEPDEAFAKPQKVYAKTLRLTSDQLKSLNLKKGPNTVSFTVTSAYWGTAVCAAKIFYWDYNIQIVISDIDGTITKSDALGHVFSMIGKDWTHLGVAKLYTGIANNGYHFLYLTSRAIGQADYTRDYLKRIIQDKYQLPDGPVIMSPDRLFTSLHREVIIRKPEVFKMACLRDVQRLFGGRDPFYAGFGNRITDARSYRSVNVPTSRIFTIDPYGELKLELLLGFKSSYIHLQDLVDQIFPPINDSVNEEFNDINYWKAPIPDVELPELEDLPEPKSPKPRPIKPDLHALPPESVLSSTNTQRGLLRSLTSRTSTDTTKYKPISNASAPSLLLSRKVSGYSDDSLINDQKASAVMEGENDHADTSSIVSTSPPDSVKSGSIMNKMRTTLSRTFLLSSEHGNEKFVDKISEVVSLDSTHEDSKESPEDDEENKEDMDDILDSINMDDIPFI